VAITVQRITVSTSAVALNTPGTAGQSLLIRNLDATNAADLGTSTVTAGTGFPLAAGQTVEVRADAGNGLFAIRSAAADVVLAVLRT
jgi:hypothetical protein